MRHLALLFCVSLLFSQCTATDSNSAAVEQAFLDFQEAVKSGQNQEILNGMDRESRNYFHNISDLASRQDATANNLFYRYEQKPMVSLLLLEASTLLASSDSISVTPLNVILAAQLLEINIFNGKTTNRYRFVEVASVEDETATIVVKVWLEGNTWIASNYIMNKEDDEWRLNFNSTQTVLEKFLIVKKLDSGKSDAVFIRDVITGDFDSSATFHWTE